MPSSSATKPAPTGTAPVDAQPGSLEGRVAIAGIGDEGLPLGIQQRDETGFSDTEQRAQDPTIGQLADRRHPCETVRTTAGAAADQVGLRLIFTVMRSQKMEAAMLSTPFGEQRIACSARGLLDSTCWLVCRPGEDFVPDSPRLKASCAEGGFRCCSPAATDDPPLAHRSLLAARAPSDPPEWRGKDCRGRRRLRRRETGGSRSERARRERLRTRPE